MSVRHLISTILITCFLVVSIQVQAGTAQEPHEKTCALGAFKVTQIGSLYVAERAGKGTFERLGGARLFLPAQPGLTAEWIAANLKGHSTGERKHAVSYDCPLDVPGAIATVTSAGTGFWVNIQAKEPEAAREILKRSRDVLR